MSKPAAIEGSFADYRLIKGRSVLQVIVEIPVERQAEAFRALGYPLPGTEIPVAIARLNSQRVITQDVPKTIPMNETGDEAKFNSITAANRAPKTNMEKALIRAVLLCKDERFQDYIGGKSGRATETICAAYLRDECCDGKSRGLIADNRTYYGRFLQVEWEYKQWAGLITETRG